MHFNTIAITLGLAATLGAAVSVDALTDTNPQSDGIIFSDPPPFPYRDFDDDPLDIQGLPQPVVRLRNPLQSCSSLTQLLHSKVVLRETQLARRATRLNLPHPERETLFLAIHARWSQATTVGTISITSQ